jgi:ribosome biogenesis GTPase
MINSQQEFLSHFGWNDFFESQVLPMSLKNQFIARVINEEKQLYRIQFGEHTIVLSNVSGKIQFEARNRSDYPAVGDWVIAELADGSDRAVIRSILKRRSVLQRKKVGEVSEIQILAANVDYVFITTSINSDLNFSRLERYLTFAYDSGAAPVILLTKIDLCDDLDSIILNVDGRFPGVPVHAMTSTNFENTHFFKNYLMPGKTAVLVGSSGVGKSTLGNYLIGRDEMVTKEIREDDQKGKHTTTARSMYESFYGGLIIDTPGMRELQFSTHEEGVEKLFGDIESLMLECKFHNCHHKTEQGCAILSALETGELLWARWKSYNKIQNEVRHEMRKQHKWIMAEDRKVWKKCEITHRKKNKGQQ